VASVVLLGGSVRSSRFHAAIARWALDLPCAQGKTILDAWVAGVAALSAAWGGAIPLRILADQPQDAAHAGNAAKPGDRPNGQVRPDMTIDKDPLELRGTGGVLRDISGHYPPESFLLVANAAQVLLRPLPELAQALDALGGDVAVLAHADGTPTTLMLVRCGALATLPAVGFLDMKEQALPQLAARSPVQVVSSTVPLALGVRTARSYISSLRAYHLGRAAEASPAVGAQESWRSAFHIVEEGATVEAGARLHDTVVLKGGRVEKGAVLVRSVVCPGGVVRRERSTVDQFVTAPAAGKLSIGRRRKERVA
jgi:hypothetical protein